MAEYTEVSRTIPHQAWVAELPGSQALHDMPTGAGDA